MSRMKRLAASTLSRRRLLSLAAGGTLTLSVTGRVPVAAQSSSTPASTAKGTFLNAAIVHDIAVTFDQNAYDAMIDTYADTGDKEWIEATVAIDGTTYSRTGMRLKGNSSLMGLRMTQRDGAGQDIMDGPGSDLSPDAPEGLPWLIRLDKYEGEQQHDGISELVIRSNPSATSLNEAVALELLSAAGLASQRAAATAFRVNGGAPALRLTIEHPNDTWMATHFSANGLLYKGESTGDYTYRGDDPDAYAEVFDLEAGGSGDTTEDMKPLIAFLDFINNSDDQAFAAEIGKRLDIDQFAVYLAMMELLANFDDIDGPGNNAYLYYEPAAERFTVVPWDMNLAFNGAGSGLVRAIPADGQPPAGIDFRKMATPAASGGPTTTELVTPDGQDSPGGPGDVIDGGARANPLVERFNAVAEFAALVEEQSAQLRADLYDSGTANDMLARWVSVLEKGAGDMVDQATITSESEAIAKHFKQS